jgi:HEPN domain-containing protein
MKKLTREWVSKAENDHVAATTLARENLPLNDVICFHCQQSAEKYLKGLLQELGLAIAYTHDLVSLLVQLLPSHPSLKALRRGAALLSDYAVDPRYPGKKTTKRQTAAALRWEAKIRDASRNLLGIRPPRQPGKKPS